MAKSSSSSTGRKAGTKASMSSATDKLAELAQNPLARSMLAAGLVAAAAALTTNQKVRQSAKKAGREALEGAEAAADNASKIGAAIVNAATEAVRRMMVTPPRGAARSASARSASAKPASKSRTSSRSKTAAAGSAAKTASSAKPRKRAAAKPKPRASAARSNPTTTAAAPAKPRGSAARKAGAAKSGRKSASRARRKAPPKA